MASLLLLPSSLFLLLLCLLYYLTPTKGGGGLVFEEGYTVSTVLDGDKSNIKVNPHSIISISHSPPSDHFVLLDSVASSLYTVSLPTVAITSASSNETVVQRLAGNGDQNYVDGDLESARFNKPRSFAVDYSGNVYVADQRNHAIRKITKSGVTTIAGGYSQKAGHTDGPARDASFSNDFELTFVAERCALMISDRGNRLVRQINLKAEDCTRKSGSALGTTSPWLAVAVGVVSLLLGMVVGFLMHPFLTKREVVRPHHNSWTWKHCLMSAERRTVIFCSDIRNAVVKSTLYSIFRQLIILSFSNLSLMLGLRTVVSRTRNEKPVSLMDSDYVSSRNMSISPHVYDQLKDLITFDGGQMVFENADVSEGNGETTDVNVSQGELRGIDAMIQSNLINFKEEVQESSGCIFGLTKRR